eukprot:2794023-Prorocentrum_lima.AAC.1
MIFDFSETGQVAIDMSNYVRETVNDWNDEIGNSNMVTPAASDLFVIDESAQELDKHMQVRFYTAVQKLLYLAKRARPDILTAVAFLTTRVKISNVQDLKKLMRVLSYLKGTQNMKLNLFVDNAKGDEEIAITSFIDASYAVHPLDGKGHSGQATTLGRGLFSSSSKKQKLVARSSTEAELIGLADGTAHVIWVRQFLLAQGYKIGPARIAQDNKSTIILANKGRSTNKHTKHIAVRYFFVKDRIDSKEVELYYHPTEDMVADFFTKPLQGSMFTRIRDLLMNTQPCCATANGTATIL